MDRKDTVPNPVPDPIVYPHWDHRGPHCHSSDYYCPRHGYSRCTKCPED